jgi:predicted HicB family RNase H-like nuclease
MSTAKFSYHCEDAKMVTLRVSTDEREGLKMMARDANCSLNVYVRRMLGLRDRPYVVEENEE